MKSTSKDEEVKTLVYKEGNLNPQHKKLLISRGLMDYVNSRFEDAKSLKERLYRIYNDIEESPRCKCEGCNNKVKFQIAHNKYSDYCSISCARKSKDGGCREGTPNRYNQLIKDYLISCKGRTVYDKQDLISKIRMKEYRQKHRLSEESLRMIFNKIDEREDITEDNFGFNTQEIIEARWNDQNLKIEEKEKYKTRGVEYIKDLQKMVTNCIYYESPSFIKQFTSSGFSHLIFHLKREYNLKFDEAIDIGLVKAIRDSGVSPKDFDFYNVAQIKNKSNGRVVLVVLNGVKDEYVNFIERYCNDHKITCMVQKDDLMIFQIKLLVALFL